MMEIEKLIEDLRGILTQYGEKIPYGELVGAPWPYSRAGDLVWQDPEPYFIEQAASALSTLQAENAKLRDDVIRFNDILASYQNVLVPELRAELEKVKVERDAAVEDLRKHRKYKCDCCYYADKQSRFPCTECQSPISTYGYGWKWRGLKKGD